jgi:hypothetical protein
MSNELRKRWYLVDAFGGGATVEANETPDSESLAVHVVGRQLGAYGGISIFGNANISPEFDPIDLHKVRTIQILYKQMPSNNRQFFLKLKNLHNFETSKIPIDVSATRADEFRIFELSTIDPVVTELVNSGDAGSLLINLSIAVEVGSGDSARIEIGEIRFVRDR